MDGYSKYYGTVFLGNGSFFDGEKNLRKSLLETA